MSEPMTLTDAASAAEYIERLAADYLRDHASNEHDTDAIVFHNGEAGRDYHSTLVELAEDLRSHVKPAPTTGGDLDVEAERREADSMLRELVELRAIKGEYDAAPHMHHVYWMRNKLADYELRWPAVWNRAEAWVARSAAKSTAPAPDTTKT